MVSALWANSDEAGSILERSDMAFRDLVFAPQLAGRLASWCHCAAIRRNLNFGSAPGLPVRRRIEWIEISVRPNLNASKS
jgi:hypothetical protein